MTIVAAKICGADEIYKTGGVQSIAALHMEQNLYQKLIKLLDLEEAFVTIAKSIVSENTSIDMLAGPTELGIVADSTLIQIILRYDLISQAEHSSDTFCYVITTF